MQLPGYRLPKPAALRGRVTPALSRGLSRCKPITPLTPAERRGREQPRRARRGVRSSVTHTPPPASPLRQLRGPRTARYLHRKAATLNAEAPGRSREAVNHHIGVLRVGVVDAQEARAGSAHAQAAEAEERRPREVAQNQHNGAFVRILRVLLAPPHRPAPPRRAGGGARLPQRRSREETRGHARGRTAKRDRLR